MKAFKILAFLPCLWAGVGSSHSLPPAAGPAPEHPEKIAPWLLGKLEAGVPSEMLIILDGTVDLSSAGGFTEHADRGRFVYDTLRSAALQSQGPLVTRLRSRGLEVTQFWIVNAVLVRGNLFLAQEVSALPEVARIVGNPVVHGLEDYQVTDRLDAEFGFSPKTPFPDREAYAQWFEQSSPEMSRTSDSSSTAQGGTEAIECGVSSIKATDVWTQKGVRGEGIVVASMDTGVEWTHPALQTKYRGWYGGFPDHSYSWHDAIQHTTVPFDDNNHGTHTTGTMVGDDGAGNQIGVAPGARWIACRNMDHGNGRPSTYIECAQWGLAPYPEGADPLRDGRPDLAADITNNSWSCPPSEGCDAFSLQQAYENIRAAGQMTVAAAQNSGPNCSTVVDPLGIYDAVFSAGALSCSALCSGTSSVCSLASFSSRGPVTSDGSGRLKPVVHAHITGGSQFDAGALEAYSGGVRRLP